MKFYVLPFAMIALLLFGGCSNSDPGAEPPATSTAPGVVFKTDCTAFPGTVDCGPVCTDTRVDPANCGGCGIQCTGGQTCNSGQCSTCAAGVTECGGTCTSLSTDTMNCGRCGNVCPGGAVCSAGVCSCAAGDQSCGGACVAKNDPMNCGGCGVDCAAMGQVCAAEACAAGCGAAELDCNGSCADVQSDARNCGGCGMACAAGQACTAGVCACPVAGQLACDGACVDPMTSGLHCGACGTACGAGETCTAGACVAAPVAMGGASPANITPAAGGAAPGPVTPAGCPEDPGMIANFEGGSDKVLPLEGRAGAVEQYNDGSGMQTTTIEMEGADQCNQGVLHTVGTGFNVWGAGVGTVLAGTLDETKQPKPEYIPQAYDASKYTAISFRAKKGPGQQNPVRFSISTPETEGAPYGAGTCSDVQDSVNPCWSHLGHFLMDDEELTAQWQTYTFCFDRDYYPMFLLSHVPNEVRRAPNKALLKIQFQFNQSFDPKTAKQVAKTGGIDFYLDDLRFTNPVSCEGDVFKSTGGAKQPFGSNTPIGTCKLVPDAAKFNGAISQAYARWKTLFLRGDGGVVDPDKGWVVSEGIGYGLILTAAMGDKEAFDKIWGWAKPRMGGGLLGWKDGSGGSASDGDTDMAFGLLMAGAQWGGSFTADGKALAAQAKAKDVQGNLVRGGENFKGVFNPSYFSPGFYRKFGGWEGIIDAMYGAVGKCAASFGGLVPDWCDPNSNTPLGAAQTGAAVQAAEVCDPSTPCLAFESARTPWRIGYDLCFDQQGSSLLTGFLGRLKSGDPKIANGARVDAIIAGWTKDGPLPKGVANAMAFIGPLGVAGMGLGDDVIRDRAFRATLDIIERPEFYKTYYQNTLGLLTLLTMTGNFPTP